MQFSNSRYLACLALLFLLVPLLLWHHKIASIPTPVNIDLVPGFLQWNHNQWQMNLETGEISRRTDPEVILYSSGKRVGISYLTSVKKLSVSVDAQESLTTSEPKVVDLWGLPTVLSGRYLIRESNAQIRAVDLESPEPHVVSVPIAPIVNSAAIGEPMLQPLEGTNRFIRDNFASGSGEMSLYQIEPDQIRLLNSWQGSGWVGHCHERLYIRKLGDQLVEVRSSSDGALIESIPFPDTSAAFATVGHASIQQDLLTLYDQKLDHCVAFDLHRKALLKLPGSDYRVVLTDRSPYIILGQENLGREHELLIFDRQTDTVIQKIIAPLACKFSVHDEKHLLFTSHAHGISAVLVDMTTGQPVQRWVPYAWTSWSTLLFCPLMVLWVIAWCRSSAKLHNWAWLDIWLIGGVLAYMASYRVSSSPLERTASFLTFSTLLLSVVQCAGWWLVMTKRKLTTVISLLLAMLGVVQTAFVAVVGQHDAEQRWALLSALAMSMIFIIGMALWARRSHWIVRDDDLANSVSRTSLLDYMILTVAMAICFNAIRQTIALPGEGRVDGEFVTFLVVPALLSVFGLSVGFTRRGDLFYTAISLAVLALLLIVGVRIFELNSGESPFRLVERLANPYERESDSYHDSLVFAFHCVAEAVLIGLAGPFLATLPFRLRGWRTIATGA